MSEYDETHVRLDKTSLMIISMLVDHAKNEPPSDAGGHPSMEMHESVGRQYKQWDDVGHGLRLLLGMRLVKAAIEQGQA